MFAAQSGPSRHEQWRAEGFPSRDEFKAVQDWIEGNGLNKFGDPRSTFYKGGDPLFFSHLSRYEYILKKHPDRPWSAS